MAATEANKPFVWNINPDNGVFTQEVDLSEEAATQLSLPSLQGNYRIDAYNRMYQFDSSTIVFGEGDMFTDTAPAGLHLGQGNTKVAESGIWVRRGTTAPFTYALYLFPYPLRPFMGTTTQWQISTRDIAFSPFPGDSGHLYACGYDSNGYPSHWSAWIARVPTASYLP
jgi:hypothetical protein